MVKSEICAQISTLRHRKKADGSTTEKPQGSLPAELFNLAWVDEEHDKLQEVTAHLSRVPAQAPAPAPVAPVLTAADVGGNLRIRRHVNEVKDVKRQGDKETRRRRRRRRTR